MSERIVNSVISHQEQLQFLYPTSQRLINGLAMSTLTGQDLMVVGAPGVGKSRMLHEFASIYPQGTTFTYGCQSQTTAGHLLGMAVVQDRLKGEDNIKTDKLCLANLAVLEEAGDLSTDVIRDAMLPAADTPNRKVQIGQYAFSPFMLDRLHAIWYTSNFDRKDPGLDAWMDRTLFQFVSQPVKSSSARNEILLRQGMKINNGIYHLSESELKNLRQMTDPADSSIIVPYWLLKANDQILLDSCDKWSVSDAGRRAPESTRAMFQAITLLKAHALMSGRTIANIDDLNALSYFVRLTEEPTVAEEQILGEVKKVARYLKTEDGQNESKLADTIIATERLLLLDHYIHTYGSTNLNLQSLILPKCFKLTSDYLVSPATLIATFRTLKPTKNVDLEDRKAAVVSTLGEYGAASFKIKPDHIVDKKITFYQE